jgi:hypothetical protein
VIEQLLRNFQLRAEQKIMQADKQNSKRVCYSFARCNLYRQIKLVNMITVNQLPVFIYIRNRTNLETILIGQQWKQICMGAMCNL